MLNGSIDIRSQVGQGTEVIVRIPMMRASGIDSMPSTPSLDDIGGPSLGRSIRALRTEYSKRRVLFYRPGGDSGSIGHLTETHRVLDHYIYNWFGLEVVSSLSSNKHVDVIIIDEKDLSRVIEIPIVFSSILLLGGNLSRYSGRRPSPINDSHHVEFVSKPLGPYKLAKALHLCFKHAANTDSRTDPMDAPYEEALSSLNAPTENLNFERLNLDGLNGDTSVTIWVNEVLSASNTLNARMAVDTLSSNDTECGVQANQISEFPFPGHENTKPGSNFNSQDELNMERPKFNKRITEPSALCLPLDAYLSGEKKNANTDLEDPLLQKQFTPKATNPSVKNLSPRLLLVDDNNINLRLLETFMRKRKYNLVDSAVNGELAVKAAESHQEGYDIIFMGDCIFTFFFLGIEI